MVMLFPVLRAAGRRYLTFKACLFNIFTKLDTYILLPLVISFIFWFINSCTLYKNQYGLLIEHYRIKH